MAQNKIDINGQRMLNDYNALNRVSVYSASGQQEVTVMPENPVPSRVSAIVTLAEGYVAEDLAAAGYDIQVEAGDMAIVTVALADMDALTALDCVKHVAFGGEAVPMMDLAREASNVDAVVTGNDASLSHGYTGKGVVASLFDTGMDPNHVNFLDADGKSRVSQIWTVTGGDARTVGYTTEADIAGFTTENRNETHGTHVLGIMAGSYNGEAEYAGTTSKKTGNIPYFGVATDAELVVTCGDLYNANILVGVKKAIDYAKSQGKPAVVNLSLGNTSGPHDGSDSFGRMLSEYGKDALIVISAGNDGGVPMSINKKCTGMSKILRTFLGRENPEETSLTGTVEFYASDATPFKFSVVIYSVMDRKVVYQLPVNSTTSGRSTYLGGSKYTGGDYKHDASFDAMFTDDSYVAVSTNVGTNNNRYYAVVQHSLKFKPGNNYYLGFIVEGTNGQTINGYANVPNNAPKSVFTNNSISGYTAGTDNGTINDMACGDNTVCVGSYTTRASWSVLGGGGYNFGERTNEISSFSSYGQRFDGKTLPHVCAPGSAIISSISSFYVNATGNKFTSLCGQLDGQTRSYYWDALQGTSMSSPFAAGVFALWLEANPNLTANDVIDILQATSKKDSNVTSSGSSSPWGAGKLDALAGIKEALRRTGSVGTVMADDELRLVVTPAGEKRYSVFVAGETAMKVSVFSASGALVATTTADGDETTVDLTHVAQGVYVLSVDGVTGHYARRVIVK